MRAHTTSEAQVVVDVVEEYQSIFLRLLGHRMAYVSDEYYLLAGREFPPIEEYGEFAQHENGIGMCRLFGETFAGRSSNTEANRGGFFASVDGAPALGYRAPTLPERASVQLARRPTDAKVTVLTGDYGARVLRRLLEEEGYGEVEVLAVENRFFGGNIAVAGLITGEDLTRALDGRDATRRYLLPDVCLSEGRFLDGLTLADLPLPVEVVEATGHGLARALGTRSRALAGTGRS